MPADELDTLLSCYYNQASKRAFPAFLDSDITSTPLNSAPYVTSLSHFCEAYPSPPRQGLAAQLKLSISELNDAGLSVDIALVGGSFLTLKSTPGDLDIVLFYSLNKEEIAFPLDQWQRAQKLKGLDVRLVPMDTRPILTLKMALFFALLYTHKKYDGRTTPGLVLIDCKG
jgi:hypothetical protein